jgi:ketosteroid isomerase-like protein
LFVGLLLFAHTGCASVHRSGTDVGAVAGSSERAPRVAESAEVRAVREARAAQNRAIAIGDLTRIASVWTEDVEIRRGLGALIVGRDAYLQLFAADTAGPRDSVLVYQREPTTVEISPQWPLAYESGTWAGHMGRADGPVVIGGRYAAQWVKRGGRWLIRGEVYVALSCADAGCRYAATP